VLGLSQIVEGSAHPIAVEPPDCGGGVMIH
jgi:hypothetical protein